MTAPRSCWSVTVPRQWYSGSNSAPITLIPATAKPIRGAVAEVLAGVEAGQEPGIDELVTLFGARGPEVTAVAQLADQLRREVNGNVVTWVHNRNINYTNVCTFKCRFCGFSKGPMSLNLRGTPYLLTLDDIAERASEAWDKGATEVTLQGGIHPDFDGDYYIDVARAVKDAVPGMHVHGFTALEVTEGAKRLGEDLESYLRRLKEAGLASLPGTAAEILDDEIRAILCPDKINTEEWLECHRVAHRVGLHSNVTIMAGSVERPLHWARHLVRTRDLQKETGGFTEFVPLPFVHMASPIYLQHKSRRGPDLPRMPADPRRRAHRLPRPHRQHPGQLGQDRPRRRTPVASGRLQRPGWHAHEREHLARGGRQPRPGDDPGALRRVRRPAGPRAGAAHHQLRPGTLPPSDRPDRMSLAPTEGQVQRQPAAARSTSSTTRLGANLATTAAWLANSGATALTAVRARRR